MHLCWCKGKKQAPVYACNDNAVLNCKKRKPMLSQGEELSYNATTEFKSQDGNSLCKLQKLKQHVEKGALYYMYQTITITFLYG